MANPDTNSQYPSATSSSAAVAPISYGYGLDLNTPPQKAAGNTEGKISKPSLLEILQMLVFLFDAGRECYVFLHTQSEKTSLFLKQLTVTPSTLGKVAYK